MRRFENPEAVHAPAASYSHQVVIENERLLITSGQIGMKADGSIPDDPHDQLAVAFENVVANVDAAGMELTDIIKLTFFLVGPMDAAKRRQQIADALGGHRPTMTVVYVVALGSDEMKVEIEATASRSV